MVNTIDHIRDMIFGLSTPVELDNKTKIPAINLDNAATTPPFKKVMDEMQQQLRLYGSIGRGVGQKSEHSTNLYIRGREIIKNFLGAAPENQDGGDDYTVVYIQNTTDGINKLASALIESPEDIIITTRMEHHANDLPWRERAECLYADVDDKGRLLLEDIKRLLEENEGKVKYVCVTAASNVTGYVNDIHRIAKLAHQHGAKIVVDGAQIVSHRAVNMLGECPGENIDFFVFSAHKMYSPFGGGAIVGLKEILDKHIPAFYGGGMVEAVSDDDVCYVCAPDSYEAGSPNYPGVVGMLKAIEILQSIGFGYIKRYEKFLMRRIYTGLKKFPNVILYGDCDDISDRVGVIPFNLRGIPPKIVAEYLAGSHGISVRHAAFCAHPYVHRLTGEELQSCNPPSGMVRVSFGVYSNEADVDAFLRAIAAMLDGDRRPLSSNSGGKNGEYVVSNKPFDRG